MKRIKLDLHMVGIGISLLPLALLYRMLPFCVRFLIAQNCSADLLSRNQNEWFLKPVYECYMEIKQAGHM